MRFCVQLLLDRGATTPSSQNTVNTKSGIAVVNRGRAHQQRRKYDLFCCSRIGHDTQELQLQGRDDITTSRQRQQQYYRNASSQCY